MAAWIKNNLLRPPKPDLVAVQPSALNRASKDIVRRTTTNIKVGFIWPYISLGIIQICTLPLLTTSVFNNNNTYVLPFLDLFQNIILIPYLSSSPWFSLHGRWSSVSTYSQAKYLICTITWSFASASHCLVGYRMTRDTQHGAGNTRQGSAREKDQAHRITSWWTRKPS